MSNPTNTLKTPLARSIKESAQQQVAAAAQRAGKALPCRVVAVDGSIVTVAFTSITDKTLPQVTCPHFGPEYIRYPTKVGDLGVVFPCDVFIGPVTGLGAATADLTPAPNLSALVFFPVANKGWKRPGIDPNQVTIYGPNGAKITTSNEDWTIYLTPVGIAIFHGATPIMTFDGTGDINLLGRNLVITDGDLIVDGLSFKKHLHGGVTAGGDNTGEPSGNGP